MARYRIVSYEKVPQSFLASINGMDNGTGQVMEPYDVDLEKFVFFGLSFIIVL